MKILSFGEILFDIIEDDPHLGGAPLNFAAHVSQCGMESYIYSKVGNDELGKAAIKEVKKLGVNPEFIQQDEQHPTGTVTVTLSKGQPEYVIHTPVAYDFMRYEQEVGEIHFDLLYFGSLAQRNDLSRITLKTLAEHNSFRHIFYDVNLRKGCYNRGIIHESLNFTSILKLNDGEVMVLSELLFEKALSIKGFCNQVVKAYPVKLILITAGEKGSYVYQNGELEFVSGYKAEVSDTVGAGDAFSAGFVFKYLQSDNAISASKTANYLGAYVASRRGAIPKYDEGVRKMLGHPVSLD